MQSDRPTLTQVQIIQSLAEALSWLEKEISWGVSPGELNHLTGRIGELYAAMITRGQMALDTNQRGYDVVSASNERISVKTVTTSTHVSFNQNTFHFVDRVMVLRVNIDDEKGVSVEELLDTPSDDAKKLMRSNAGKLVYPISRGAREERPVEDLEITARAPYGNLEVIQYESGAIRISRNGELQPVVVKEVLRPIATEVGVDLFNSKGALKNTQQLGADVIRALNAKRGR
ncbi:hypothetical protein G6L94_00035 [Agrobacterium rhizogenes]|uniref:DUF6998 domain-containing protein n=1 Tax=Rhizobium rhizogenes TaxID=359 RepID=UPI0004D461ED|nr:hypothetical protein [Rhizobium rhizogenes]OCJ29839.1 hypothetical protein A6U89_25835 [Agrobacterium sp. B133/95]KEA04717.1 hypothetical protein CN09_18040 [Rhizobium rhizogenes]MQB33820.1 hypothetical protein [Rhizobium rhizogenes]NTI43462.1 hypothetical protein [Rhizobium rhizogenes]NTI46695.1 hypothetical protein [Rhizobium rhizogenes]